MSAYEKKVLLHTQTLLGLNCFSQIYTQHEGKTFYELNDHLGNVTSVINDQTIYNTTSGIKTASVVSASDYFPYGMEMPGRVFSSSAYSYGFNGKEKDNELKGNSNSYDFHTRILDPRTGGFLSLDPHAVKYPSASPYTFVNNNPILNIDPDGADVIVSINGSQITINASIHLYGAGATKTVAKLSRTTFQKPGNTGRMVANGLIMIM